jgi:hypothetical protein
MDYRRHYLNFPPSRAAVVVIVVAVFVVSCRLLNDTTNGPIGNSDTIMHSVYKVCCAMGGSDIYIYFTVCWGPSTISLSLLWRLNKMCFCFTLQLLSKSYISSLYFLRHEMGDAKMMSRLKRYIYSVPNNHFCVCEWP